MLPTDARSSNLSPARRAKRGFTRLGFALAVIVLLIGTVWSIAASYETAESNANRHKGMLCLRAALQAGKLFPDQTMPAWADGERSGCPGARYLRIDDIQTYNAPAPSFALDFASGAAPLLGFTVALAMIVFAIPWAIGWVIAGFLRD